jgi:hypothetical protein
LKLCSLFKKWRPGAGDRTDVEKVIVFLLKHPRTSCTSTVPQSDPKGKQVIRRGCWSWKGHNVRVYSTVHQRLLYLVRTSTRFSKLAGFLKSWDAQKIDAKNCTWYRSRIRLLLKKNPRDWCWYRSVGANTVHIRIPNGQLDSKIPVIGIPVPGLVPRKEVFQNVKQSVLLLFHNLKCGFVVVLGQVGYGAPTTHDARMAVLNL